jgi:hypothetical protein
MAAVGKNTWIKFENQPKGLYYQFVAGIAAD